MKYLFVLLVIIFLTGCRYIRKTPDVGMTYRVFASDFDHNNSKDICLEKSQLFHKNEYFLGANQVFFKVTNKEMVEASKKLTNLIDSCINTGNGIKPKPIDSYFRQYFGYEEQGHKYIYINLCAFYNEKYKETGMLISDCYLNSILSTPERGYAGHVIIDLYDYSVKDYYFEKYPE